MAERLPKEPTPAPRKPKRDRKANGSGPLGFEDTLWKAADKVRGSMDASEYKHVVLGLVFLKYIDDAFGERREKLRADLAAEGFGGAEAEELLESRDEYTAEGVFWVPPDARWGHLRANAKQPEIGKLIDNAMDLVEIENPTLRGVLPKSFSRPALDVRRLGELVDLVSGIGLGLAEHLRPTKTRSRAGSRILSFRISNSLWTSLRRRKRGRCSTSRSKKEPRHPTASNQRTRATTFAGEPRRSLRRPTMSERSQEPGPRWLPALRLTRPGSCEIDLSTYQMVSSSPHSWMRRSPVTSGGSTARESATTLKTA